MQKALLKCFVTVLVFTNMVACAKKDDDKSPVRTATATPDKQLTTPKADAPKATPIPELKGADATKPQVAQPDAQKNAQAQAQAPAQTPAGTGGQAQKEEKKAEGDQKQTEQKQVEQKQTEQKQAGQQQEQKGATKKPEAKKDSANTNKDTQFKGKPTGLAEDYAAAGDDYLVEYISQQMKSIKDKAVQKRNLLAAESIESIETKIDSKTGDVIVTLNRTVGKTLKKEMLGGTINRAGITRLGSENQNLRGKFVCMDEDQAFCQTAVLDIEFGKGADKAIVKAVLRKTAADFFWTRPTLETASADFKNLFDLFDNSERRTDVDNSLKTILVESTEIINGRSHARVTFVTEGGQVMSMSAPLLLPRGSTGLTNVRMERNIRFESLIDIMLIQDVKTGMQQALQNAQLVKVEGGKFLTIQLEVRGQKRNEKQAITVRLERIHPEIKMIEK